MPAPNSPPERPDDAGPHREVEEDTARAVDTSRAGGRAEANAPGPRRGPTRRRIPLNQPRQRTVDVAIRNGDPERLLDLRDRLRAWERRFKDQSTSVPLGLQVRA